MSDNFLEQINALIPIHQGVADFNPAIANLYPVVVSDGDQLLIYDTGDDPLYYEFIKRIPAPMPIPRGVRAAFQLADYGGRIACVVTADVFAAQEGYVTILHEFVHCYQYETCEQALKMTLDVARQAQENGDVMWEIQHPFPYQAEAFIRAYGHFLQGVARQADLEIQAARADLRSYLGVHDYEYMVWQEWKEGFARWVENGLQQKLGLPVNKAGWDPPFSRVSFYAGGAAYIALLNSADPALVKDLESLFTCLCMPLQKN